MMPNHPDDEALRRYLLGELPEAEADLLEVRLLAEGDLAELASAVADELVEECDRGEISPEQRAFLLARLAASAGGRQRLAFHQALKKAGQEKTWQRILFFRPRRQDRPTSRKTLPAKIAAGLAAAALVGLVGIRVGEQFKQRSVPIHQVVALVSTRSAGGLLQVAVDRDRQLALEVVELGPVTDFSTFRATIKRAGGETVWSGESGQGIELQAGGASLVLSLPAGELAEGIYRLNVEGFTKGGESQIIGATKFEVVVP